MSSFLHVESRESFLFDYLGYDTVREGIEATATITTNKENATIRHKKVIIIVAGYAPKNQKSVHRKKDNCAKKSANDVPALSGGSLRAI